MKTKEKLKYHVYYVERCGNLRAEFDTRKEMQAFVGRFHMDHLKDLDSWICMIVRGRLIAVDPDLELYHRDGP